MKLPITIDPRYHDAVLFDLDGALISGDVPIFGTTVDLARKLQGIGVAAGAYSSSPQCQQSLKAAGI
ncbi:MAG TPA: trehalose phosphatase, partial [Mycobacterium sp.]|nr:trehalose phosphatase [Mycobacterium sp.]